MSEDPPEDPLASEALYVCGLVVGPGSTLDLNGLTVYYKVLENAGTIEENGGALFQIVVDCNDNQIDEQVEIGDNPDLDCDGNGRLDLSLIHI